MWELMKKWIKGNKKLAIILFVGLFVGVPVIVYLLSVIPFLPIGGNNDWAGFWGGYLGAIIGGLITLYVLSKTIEDNRKNQERDKKVEYCNYLVEQCAEYCEALAEFLVIVNRYRTYKKAYCQNNKKPRDLEKEKREFLMKDYERCLILYSKLVKYIVIINVQLNGKLENRNYDGLTELNNISDKILECINILGYYIDKDNIEDTNEGTFKGLVNEISKEKQNLVNTLIEFMKNNVNM